MMCLMIRVLMNAIDHRLTGHRFAFLFSYSEISELVLLPFQHIDVPAASLYSLGRQLVAGDRFVSLLQHPNIAALFLSFWI